MCQLKLLYKVDSLYDYIAEYTADYFAGAKEKHTERNEYSHQSAKLTSIFLTTYDTFLQLFFMKSSHVTYFFLIKLIKYTYYFLHKKTEIKIEIRMNFSLKQEYKIKYKII